MVHSHCQVGEFGELDGEVSLPTRVGPRGRCIWQGTQVPPWDYSYVCTGAGGGGGGGVGGGTSWRGLCPQGPTYTHASTSSNNIWGWYNQNQQRKKNPVFLIKLFTWNTIYFYEHISMFTQLYSPRYTQHIKAYNSVLSKSIHLFKVKNHLYVNIHISASYIKAFPNEFGSGFNILIWHQYSESKVIITVIKIRL